MANRSQGFIDYSKQTFTSPAPGQYHITILVNAAKKKKKIPGVIETMYLKSVPSLQIKLNSSEGKYTLAKS